MSDESSEQISAEDTSKNETEAQSDGEEDMDTKKTEDKEDSSKKVDDKGDDDEDAEDGSSEEEETLPAGLLEKPVLIEDGKKRERKKVERISFKTETTKSTGVEIKEGKGRSLGDIPFIEYQLQRVKAEDCKPLHRVLYRRACQLFETKKNIRQFSGFPFPKDDKEYEKRIEILNSKKYSIAIIKKMLDILDIAKSGTKTDLITRLMEWLEKPKDSNRKIPTPKRKRSSTGGKKKGGKKKESKKSKETVADAASDSDNEVNDSDDGEKDDNDDTKDDDDDDNKADSSEDEEEEEEEEKAPPKKKRKKSSPKPVKEKKQRTPKSAAKEKKQKTPIPTNKKKVTPKKKKEDIEDEFLSSSSDDEPLVAKKKSKGPPTNDELKDVVKKMLDNANLEQVTMKTVLKNVFAKYPDHDLMDRKDFIKNTVKQIIS